jgi:hypothetical protein
VTRCYALPAAAGYRVVELAVQRPGQRQPLTVRVHVADHGRWRRIIGVER